MQVQDIVTLVTAALKDIKGKDIINLETSKLTSLFQHMIVATGDSTRQVKALANNVHVQLKAAGVTIVGREGHENGEWAVIDAGDVVVHVMLPTVRDYYDIESLWGASQPNLLATRRHLQPTT